MPGPAFAWRVLLSTAGGVAIGVAGALIVGYGAGIWSEVVLLGAGIAGFLLGTRHLRSG